MRKARIGFLTVAGAVCIGLPIPILDPAAFAEELSVADCSGLPRAVKEVEESSLSLVEVRVTDERGMPANDVVYTLKNANTGEKNMPVKDGKALFQSVAPGTWSLCSDSKSHTISKVTIVGAEKEAGLTTAAVIGGIAAGGSVVGVLAGGFGGGSDSNGDSTALTGSGSNGGSVTTGSDGGSATLPASNRHPSVSAAEGDCLSTEEPEPVSPVS